MKCPYCNSEMEQGYLHSKGVYWSKDENRFFIFPNKSKGDIVIVSGWKGPAYEASYVCRECGKIIIDVNVSPANENY